MTDAVLLALDRMDRDRRRPARSLTGVTSCGASSSVVVERQTVCQRVGACG